MNKRVLCFGMILLNIWLVGCSFKPDDHITDDSQNKTQIAEAAGYDIRFYLSESWQDEPIEAWHLHYVNGASQFAASLYKCMDLADGQTQMDVFEDEISSIAALRDYFQEVDDDDVELLNNEFVTTKLFSGERDGAKYWYYFALVDFGDDKDFASILFVATPSHVKANIEMYNEILRSAELY